MMANSSRSRRYGSAGASVLLAASLSLCALPSVAAANTPNPDNPPVITVYNYKVETNTRELKTALRLNKITFKASKLPAKTTAFAPALHEANHRGFPFLNPIQTVRVEGPFKDGAATATHYVPGSLIDPAKNYSFVANIIVDGYGGGQVLRMNVVKDSAAPVLHVDSPRLNTKGETVLKVRGTGYTGEDGFELFCGAEDAVDLWTVITSAAAALEPTVIDGEPVPALTPCGLAARDSLRLEAGMPLYGHELHEGMTPYDAGLGAVVRLDKGDFIGRDALAARAEQEGTEGTSVLVPLTAEGRRAARAGAPVLGDDGEVLGTVTSGLLSPTLGHPVALALLRPWREDAPAWPVGTALVADVRGRPLEVTVVDSPFYKRTR